MVISLLLIAAGAALAFFASQSIESGTVSMKGLTFKRDKQPRMFWFGVAAYGVSGGACLLYGAFWLAAALLTGWT